MANKDLLIGLKELQKKFNKSIESVISGYRSPHSHITHNHNRILLEVKLPNIKKKNLTLDIDEKRVEVIAKNESKKRDEYGFMGFYRKISFPEGLDIKKARTKLYNGKLKIYIPRKK